MANSSSNIEYDFTFKIITAGEGGVGKTTMLHRYVEGKFLFNTKMTIGVEIFNKNFILDNGEVCALQLWDFGGQNRFRFFQDSFVLGANGAFLMFDLTKIHSFLKLDEWIDIVRKYDPHLPVLLLGAKCDLKDEIVVRDEMAINFVKKYNLMGYLKTSSKENYNVDKAFGQLVAELLPERLEEEISDAKPVKRLNGL